MNCVKCGKETEENNVFCSACLAEMGRYPVKPDTKVHIPARPEPVERKQSRPAKEKTLEEQIASLHKTVQMLIILVISLAAALLVSLGVLGYVLAEDAVPEETRSTPQRRNYSTTAPADTD